MCLIKCIDSEEDFVGKGYLLGKMNNYFFKTVLLKNQLINMLSSVMAEGQNYGAPSKN